MFITYEGIKKRSEMSGREVTTWSRAAPVAPIINE